MDIVKNLRDTYNKLSYNNLHLLGNVYTEDIIFIDQGDVG